MSLPSKIVMTQEAAAIIGYPPEVIATWTVAEFIVAAWRAGYEVDVREVDLLPGEDGGVYIGASELGGVHATKQ